MVLYPRIVKESYAEIEPYGDAVISYFYGWLFAERPELRALFPPMMDKHRDLFLRALGRIVCTLDNPGALASFLSQLGRAHRKFGVLEEHYDAVGRALLAALRKYARRWSEEIAAAWTAVYATVAETMIASAAADDAETPPWWLGEVIGHERRTADIAVVTIRPHRPFPFQAGQYLTVQTARWPRVWRPYSIANAPRHDGTLTLHVRAVPAGWVSGALVRHTGVGDTLLLGPAAGSMTLGPDRDRPIVGVAGGTGLAPVKALAQEAIRSGRGEIRILAGARTAADLYDLPSLRRLEAECPRLRVIPIVSDDPDYGGPRGPVTDALEHLGEWEDHDVYVAGPEAMVGRTVAELHRLGVPPERVRHDLPLEMRTAMDKDVRAATTEPPRSPVLLGAGAPHPSGAIEAEALALTRSAEGAAR